MRIDSLLSLSTFGGRSNSHLNYENAAKFEYTKHHISCVQRVGMCCER